MPLLVGSWRTKSVMCLGILVVVVAVGMSLCVDVIVKSSAYNIIFMLPGSVVHVDVKECGELCWGISCMR